MNYYALVLILICVVLGIGLLWYIRKKYRTHMLLISVGVTLLLAIILYHSYLLGDSKFLYSTSDGFLQFLPIYKDYIRTLEEGNDLPLWNFSIGFGGVQSYIRLFCPFNLIPILTGVVFNEEAMMISTVWMQVCKIVLAEIFMFLFLKKLKFNDFVCFHMGIVYAFCGLMILRGNWWSLSDEFYIAMFILWGVECYFQDKNWHWIPPSIALLVCTFGVYRIYLYALELFIYATARYVYDKKTLKGYFGFIFKCGGLYLIGCLMMGVTIFDSLNSMFGTVRYAATTSYAAIVSLIERVDLKILASAVFSIFDINCTGVFHLYTGALNYLERPIFYCGIACLFLIPQALILSSKREKRYISFGLLLAGAYMLFPMVTDIFNLFIKNEELGFRSYRLSSLWIVIMMIVIAGYGLQCGVNKGSFDNNGLILTGITLVTVFLFCLLDAPQNEIVIDYNVCRWVVLFLLLWLIFFSKVKWVNKSGIIKVSSYVILICISLLELGHSARTSINVSKVYADQYYNIMREDALGYYSDVQAAVDYIRSYDKDFYRIAGIQHDVGAYCAPLYYGVYDSSYYTNIDGETYEFLNEVYPESFVNNLGTKYSLGVGEDLYLSALTGYKYLLVNKNSDYIVPYGYRLLTSSDTINIYQNEKNLSLGITYDMYIKESVFRNYSDDDQRKILLYAVVLEDDIHTDLEEITEEVINEITLKDNYAAHRICIEERMTEDFDIQTWTEDHIVGNTILTQDKCMVFSIPNVKGWKLYVDGVQRDILSGNIGFMAVNLTAGEHTIELKYQPTTLLPSIIISIIALLIYCLMLMIDFKYINFKNLDKHVIWRKML